MQELSKINLYEQQSKNKFEKKIGLMIGLENAAIKTLKMMASRNKKDSKTNKKNFDVKAQTRFNRIRTKKLAKVFDNIEDCKINQTKVEEIAMETENRALATIRYYLMDADTVEQDCNAYKSSKFLCLSQEGNTIDHTCCHFY